MGAAAFRRPPAEDVATVAWASVARMSPDAQPEHAGRRQLVVLRCRA